MNHLIITPLPICLPSHLTLFVFSWKLICENDKLEWHLSSSLKLLWRYKIWSAQHTVFRQNSHFFSFVHFSKCNISLQCGVPSKLFSDGGERDTPSNTHTHNWCGSQPVSTKHTHKVKCLLLYYDDKVFLYVHTCTSLSAQMMAKITLLDFIHCQCFVVIFSK